jgi:undecaprenyl diphosphate synthase
VIPDGNGRWALARGRPRLEGHRAGVEAFRRVVEAAPALGVGTLTVYAFSADNWERPQEEVAGLHALFGAMLRCESPRCAAEGVRLRVVGRRDRLAPELRDAIHAAEAATEAGERLLVRLAIDYSARDSILRAALLFAGPGDPTRRTFAGRLAAVDHSPEPALDVDLLVRTGGEKRLSDFLLWENAYAELYFTPTMWPDFDGEGLAAAIRDFHTRERRFGRLGASISQRPSV